MSNRLVRVLKTSVGRGYFKLRVVVDLRKDQAERLGWEEGTEVEAVDRPDGVLLRRKT